MTSSQGALGEVGEKQGGLLGAETKMTGRKQISLVKCH